MSVNRKFFHLYIFLLKVHAWRFFIYYISYEWIPEREAPISLQHNLGPF